MLMSLKIGGSLAGLMVGVALKGLGHHVRIFERYPATRMEGQGAGITAHVDVQHFFIEMGNPSPHTQSTVRTSAPKA